MTTGYQNATIDDLNSIDFNEINIYYDYLKNAKLKFLHVDMRKDIDIMMLFNETPNNSTMWISNVLHYITTLNYYDVNRYELIDRLAKEKDIELLPHTRVYYENTHNM